VYSATVGVPSPFGPLAVIVDPRAGEGRVARELVAVERALANSGLDHRLWVAGNAAETTRLAGDALGEGFRFVAAVGDDATVQDVVNGMFHDGRTIVDSPVLAVIAANSGCDLVKSFGLPGDVEGAAAHLLGERTYPFDLMKVAVTAGDERRIRYAHNLAEVGLHAAVTRRTARLPKALGTARRFVGFWSVYASTRPRRLTVGTDTKTREVRAWSVVIGNGQFADGGLRLSPRSFPGDGVIDALVFAGPKSDAYRLLPRVFRHGDHVPDPNIHELKAKLSIAIASDRPMPVVADGTYLGTTPVSFQVVPQQILLKL
jgi:diacylglycerol kinase (ATP)